MTSVLTYPVEVPYRLRWVTPIFYTVSVILIILLIVLNFALTGYEQVTVLMRNPNTTDHDSMPGLRSMPSAFRFMSDPGECQETSLPLNTPLRTNSSLSLFKYNVLNNFDKDDAETDSLGLRGRTPYKANPLDICRVQNMSIAMELLMLSFDVRTTLLCSPVGDPPRARRFEVSFRRAHIVRFRPDTILEYMAYVASPNETDSSVYQRLSQKGPPKNPYLNALAVVDVLGRELINTLIMRKDTWLTNDPPVLELGYLSWDSGDDNRPPTDESRIIDLQTYLGGRWYPGFYIRPFNATIINLMVAVRDAIHLDIGYVAPNNIYVNKTSFNSMITVDAYRPKLIEAMYINFPNGSRLTGPCSWGWGCVKEYNSSWAHDLTSTDQPVNNITLPITLPSPLPPSVIDIAYLCPEFQIKSRGSLVVSVFAGTFTMFMTLYGFFTWLGPVVDRKRKGPHAWEQFLNQPYNPNEFALRRMDDNSTLHSPEREYEDTRLLLGDGKDKSI